jgi:uncharacterized protein (DUF2141 family)
LLCGTGGGLGGMSNNPHATIKAPAFLKAQFSLTKDTEIHVQMQ